MKTTLAYGVMSQKKINTIKKVQVIQTFETEANPEQVLRCNENDGDDELADGSDDEQPFRLKNKKKKKLSAFDVSQIVKEKGLKTMQELQSLAYEQKKEGKTDLAEFLISRSPRVVADIVNTSWEIEGASAKLSRAKKSRMQLLQEVSNTECVEGCNGQWLLSAMEILENNGISPLFCSTAVKELLLKGRGKNRNILITGHANCSKTFLPNPLTTIYETFCNPATGSFAWVGVENAECIFLNNFHWCSQLTPWHDLLFYAGGASCSFASAENTLFICQENTLCARYISLVRDTPIFCTGKSPHVLMTLKLR